MLYKPNGDDRIVSDPDAVPRDGAAVLQDASVVPQLVRLFIQVLRELAAAGEKERACMMAAQGWSVLRHGYPREAQRLNGLLHALTGSTHPRHDPEP